MLALALVVVVLEGRRRHQGTTPPPVVSTTPAAATSSPPSAAPSEPTFTKPRPLTEEDRVPYIENWVWGDIDLRGVQAAMPDNLYWKLGAPTKDPAVLEAREQEKKQRNEEYGRVLSGDATEEEVNAYYAYRERLSTDFLEIADYMRRQFDSSASDELKGMLELAVKLHTARLAQLPADREAALEHSRAQAKAREEWRKQQEEFANAAPPADDGRAGD